MGKESQNSSELCRQCALCCDGSLFMKAHLQPHELEAALAMGMSISSTDNEAVFSLPCHLLKQKSCTIYGQAGYPQACAGFHCKLLKRYLAGNVDLETALGAVQTARNLLDELQHLTPFGKDQRMTLRGIRVMAAYLFSLPEQDRLPHTGFLETATLYIQIVTRDFVQLEDSEIAPVGVFKLETV